MNAAGIINAEHVVLFFEEHATRLHGNTMMCHTMMACMRMRVPGGRRRGGTDG